MSFLNHLIPTWKQQITDLSKTNDNVLHAIDEELKVVTQETIDSKLESSLATAGGEWLDQFGALFDVIRADGQDDEVYRDRILRYVRLKRGTIPALIDAINEYLECSAESIIYEPFRNIFYLNQSDLNGVDKLMGSYYRPAVIEIIISCPFDEGLKEVVDKFKPAGVTVHYTYKPKGTDSGAPIVSYGFGNSEIEDPFTILRSTAGYTVYIRADFNMGNRVDIGDGNLWLGDQPPTANIRGDAREIEGQEVSESYRVYKGERGYQYKANSEDDTRYLRWKSPWVKGEVYTASVYVYDPFKRVTAIRAYDNISDSQTIETGEGLYLGGGFYRYQVTFTSPIDGLPSHGILLYLKGVPTPEEIEAEGRNLELDSNFENGTTNGWGQRSSNDISVKDGILEMVTTNVYGADRIEKYFTGLDIGETYTLSIYASLSMQLNWSGLIGSNFIGETGEFEKGIFKVYSITFIATAITATIRGFMRNLPIGAKTRIDWYKLEKGNKATDWTPHPDEYEGITVSGFSLRKGDVSENVFTTNKSLLNSADRLAGSLQLSDPYLHFTRTAKELPTLTNTTQLENVVLNTGEVDPNFRTNTTYGLDNRDNSYAEVNIQASKDKKPYNLLYVFDIFEYLRLRYEREMKDNNPSGVYKREDYLRLLGALRLTQILSTTLTAIDQINVPLQVYDFQKKKDWETIDNLVIENSYNKEVKDFDKLGDFISDTGLLVIYLPLPTLTRDYSVRVNYLNLSSVSYHGDRPSVDYFHYDSVDSGYHIGEPKVLDVPTTLEEPDIIDVPTTLEEPAEDEED